MNKKNYKAMKKIMLILIIITFAVTACKKKFETIDINEQNNSKTMSDLNINPDFNWKTIKDINVDICCAANDVVYIKSIEGDVYHKAFLSSKENYNTKITIPTYATEVILAQGGTSTTIPITGNKISYTFN